VPFGVNLFTDPAELGAIPGGLVFS
jgi:hypothetical protein